MRRLGFEILIIEFPYRITIPLPLSESENTVRRQEPVNQGAYFHQTPVSKTLDFQSLETEPPRTC